MSDTIKAALWMIGAIVSFTTMAVAGRAVSYELDTFEIMLFRSLIGVAIVLAVGRYFGTLQQIKFRKLDLHFYRNLSHFAGQNLWFYSITVIPLAQVFALEFTSPLWVLVIAPFVLGEKLTKSQTISAIFGFVGILIVAKPSPSTFEFGLLTAALAAIGFAGSAVITRKLTRTESITCILFFLTAMQSVFGLVFAGYDGDITFPSLANWPWVVLVSVCGLVAHFCLTTALSIAPATVVMPIDFVRLPVIAIVGVVLYSEPLDPFVLIGAAIIFGANYYNIWQSART